MHESLGVALRALLAAVIAAAPGHFSTIVDQHHVVGKYDGYNIYAINAATRALCTACNPELERLSTGATHEWAVRIELPGDHTAMSRTSLDGIETMLVPVLAHGYRATGHEVDCDGATVGTTWTGALVTIEAIAGNDPGSGTNAISRTVIVTAR